MISSEREAEILRFFHVEKWRVGTIARQLGLHHATVQRVLTQAGLIPAHSPRGSMIDLYMPFIRKALDAYPTLTSSRLFEMVRERGYPGGPDHFRHLVAGLRPRKPAEAYLRVRTLPGEQAQVDWGHFGKIAIGRALRPLMAFVMVLSYSRMTFLRFYLDAKMPNFLRGHVDAFEHFGGVAKVLLYDNLKSAVLERDGKTIRFNPMLLELVKHYRFEPRPVAVARGNEKGRVERKIRHIRTSFMPARSYTSVDDLNAQAMSWCTGLAADRPCPEDTSRKVIDVFGEEKPRLSALPDKIFETSERVEVSVRKQPYARFDLNDYSIPHDRIGRTLTVVADLDTVRILDGLDLIASHPRTFDKGQQVEDPEHIEGLRESKRKAKRRSALDHLHRAVPSVVEIMRRTAEDQKSLSQATGLLRTLLNAYGPQSLETAIARAIECGTPHIGAVRQILEMQRRERGEPPPVTVVVSDDPRLRDLFVKPHDLQIYDQLMEDRDGEETDRKSDEENTD